MVPSLQEFLLDPDPVLRVAALRGLSGLFAVPPKVLLDLLGDPNPTIAELALSQVGRMNEYRADLFSLVRTHLLSTTPSAPALRAAAILEMSEVWDCCRALHNLPTGAVDVALELCAMSSDERLHKEVIAALDQPELARHALFALGFSRRIADADRCIERLRGPLFRLAAEAFSGITGVDLAKEQLLLTPPPHEIGDEGLDDFNRDLSLQVEDELPFPDCDAIEVWWQMHRADFIMRRHSPSGLLCEAEGTLIGLLRALPMRLRSPLSLALAVRTQGRNILSNRTWARRQIRILDRWIMA